MCNIYMGVKRRERSDIMKICLAMVYNGNPFEALGIEALATYVQNFGYDVDLKMINSSKIKNSDILQLFKESYSFVGFSVSYSNINDTYQLCKIIKENQNSKIFVGSQYATLNAKEILKDCEYIDFVICGEGELVLKNILDNYKIHTNINFIGQLDGVLTREKNEYSIVTIDKNLFIPIKHTLLGEKIFQNVLMARIYSSRGCCANCSFCTHNCYNTSKTWRGRSVKEVFDEMVDVHQKYGISVFMFNDSSIEDPGFLGKARLEELCEHMLKYEDELYVFCYIRAETFSEKDGQLLEKMHSAGIVSLFVGIESANEKDLKLYNKIANVQQNEQAMQLFKNKGFRIMPGFIMFNPLSDTDTLYSNFMFCKKHELYLSCYYESQLAIFKGAKIESHIREKIY